MLPASCAAGIRFAVWMGVSSTGILQQGIETALSGEPRPESGRRLTHALTLRSSAIGSIPRMAGSDLGGDGVRTGGRHAPP